MLISFLLPVGFDDVGDLILTNRTMNIVLHGKFAMTLGGASEIGGIAELNYQHHTIVYLKCKSSVRNVTQPSSSS
jgi:hypothetical protein